MEVVPMNLPRRGSPAGSVGLPFNKRNVEEWSRLDRLTGIMETAKIETDHWAARSNNAAHKYGKMVDSRERNNQDGSLQERQRKQMEVFQTQVPGGSMQVIRTQTFTTSSKSSKWTTNDQGFEDLKLPINSLDLSSQKTKGSVGRSGSIGGRRPPSRPRSLISQSSTTSIFEDSSVAKLCQRLHEEVKNEMLRNFEDFNGFNHEESDRDSNSGVVITDVTNSINSNHSSLSRQKSCSNENLTIEKEDDGILKRSKIRRSLQFPKQIHVEPEIDWCSGKSLKERAAEIENLLRRGSSVSENKILEDNIAEENSKIKKIKTRDSFVSAEALNEVRDRLKKTNLSDNDDGIGNEKEEPSKVKCFVYGMEALMANRNINGTGSLESKKNVNNHSRSAEWYKRRKSYGFEQVEEPEKLNNKNSKNIESSTDSGICRSSEIINTNPLWNSKSVITFGKKENDNVNSVYVNTPNVFSVRVENNKEESRKQMFKNYESEEAVWNRKSPIPIQRKSELRESLKSSLRSAKNPWISQLRGTKLVDRNWISDDQNESDNEEDSKANNGNGKKNKKVEFCKTEVHFAAEPGKFKLVETDGKPPPNDIFRRRKRVAHKNQSNLPELKFGDSMYEKRLLTNSEKMDSISEKIEAELKELSKIVIDSLPPSSDKDVESFKSQNPRSIYDLAEEPENNLPGSTPIWKSTVVLRNKHYDDMKEQKLYSSDGESELQIRFRNLRRKTDPERRWWEPSPIKLENKEIKRLSLPDESLLKNGNNVQKMTVTGEEFPSLSVAERIKQVEEFRSNNYSSKINFRSGEMTVVQNGTGSLEKLNGGDEGSRIISPWLQRKSEKEFGDLPKVTCEVKCNYTPTKPIPSFADTFMSSKGTAVEKPKIASIALRYEDDPLFAKNTKSTYTNHVVSDKWERSSNSSSGFSSKPRERISYLNGSSLSEKYSKYFSAETSSLNHKNSNESFQFNFKKDKSYVQDSKPIKSFAETFGITNRKKSEKLISSHKNSEKRNGPERKRSKEREETDSGILEELTKAADQILIAVNGYTDDDSHLASSEDDDKTRKIIRKDKMSNLSTISEGKRVTKTEARRSTNVSSSVKRSVGNHSSASSLESLTKETIRSRNEKPVCPRLKNAETKTMSSRATRLLQRANSREAVMAQRSSSEDIPNHVELAKKRIVRRQKSSSSVKSDLSVESKTTCCRLKSKSKANEPSVVSRARERKSTTLKDSTNTAKSTRISQSSEVDRTKSTARKSVTEKTDTTETTRKKRIPLTQHKDLQANPPSLRKKTTRVNSKKIEGLKSVQTA